MSEGIEQESHGRLDLMHFFVVVVAAHILVIRVVPPVKDLGLGVKCETYIP
jgi:hypothetical protein